MTITANGLDQILDLAGRDLGTSAWVQVTQERVDQFAHATGDHQWIHVDPERAKSGPFGGPIAHGYLTLSMLVPLLDELLNLQGGTMNVNYGLNKVRFPSPVPVGASVRLHGRVSEVKEIAGGVELTSTW